MNEIPEYLKDNPDYYIDWGDRIINNLDDIKNRIVNIINIFDNITVKYDKINWVSPCIKILSNWLEIWYITYHVMWEEMWIAVSRINDWIKVDNFNNSNNFQKQWYWKILYLAVALEAINSSKIFVSDDLHHIKPNAKYIWNSLVNLWLAEYDENIKKFKFINNMLEDYFPDKIKNTD